MTSSWPWHPPQAKGLADDVELALAPGLALGLQEETRAARLRQGRSGRQWVQE